MASRHHSTFAEQIGAGVARGWRAYLRAETAARAYLRSLGANDALVTLGVWAMRVLVVGGVACALPALGVLLYYILAAAIVVVVVVAAIRILGSGTVEIPAPKAAKWRTGFQGTGLYRGGTRIDPYDPNDPNDMF